MESSTIVLVLCSLLWTVCAQVPVVSVEPRAVGIRQGETVSFRCRVVGGSQPVHLEWKILNKSQLAAENVKIGPDGSVLTIANARISNQGQYRCVATNSAGRSTVTTTLTIKYSPKVQVTPAGPLHVRVGEPMSLECSATGKPRPTITWQRNGTPLVTTATEDNNTMQVAAVGPEHAGAWVCQAQNSEGMAEVKVEVIVDGDRGVGMAPTALVSTAELTAVAGETVNMRCQANGSPPPVISWSKLRAPLPWQHTVEGGVLTLRGLGRQDSGQYICNATNIHGYSEAYTQLEVDSPPYTTILPDQMRLRPGDSLRLQCLAHGSHPISFHWTRVGRATMPAGAETTKDGQLLIGRVKLVDSGTYRCTATNHVGSSDAMAKVTVKA
ncbi:hypothetical protein DPEC_G00169680 [Dallia pectoralis]|uniref:Uncharacterized protein n=1 Tax=Dallia pectoralis TaxID=75939 RepID=A0ACC2GCS0_DALPE|nr:hypothetical protein DPEC_G00169680 [Dallia pectoralis]